MSAWRLLSRLEESLRLLSRLEDSRASSSLEESLASSQHTPARARSIRHAKLEAKKRAAQKVRIAQLRSAHKMRSLRRAGSAA